MGHSIDTDWRFVLIVAGGRFWFADIYTGPDLVWFL